MDIRNLSVSELVAAVHAGALPVADIARQTIAAIEQHRDINALICSDEEVIMKHADILERKLARGMKLPLHGLPILAKDNIDTVDFPTTGATAALAGHRPRRDAGVITRLKQAGALLVGKANMHELAFGITSNNACTGAVHNPYDQQLIPGGSSGGSAAAVSAGIVPASLGSDTGGSNRIPAALCGVCGFRPSTGRYPGDGLINLSRTRDTAGIFARSVSDIALVDAVLSGGSSLPSIDIRDLRLAVPRDPFYKALENDTAEVIESTLQILAVSGVTLVEVDMDDIFTLNDKISFPVALYETLRELTAYLQTNVPGLSLAALVDGVKSPDVKHILEAAQAEQRIPEQAYRDALNFFRPQLKQMYTDYFDDNNVEAMIYPTTPLTARPIGDDETIDLNGRRLPTFQSYVRNGDPSSNADIPSLSIPAGLSSAGLPVGLSIDGPADCDARLLAIAIAIADAIPPITGPAL